MGLSQPVSPSHPRKRCHPELPGWPWMLLSKSVFKALMTSFRTIEIPVLKMLYRRYISLMALAAMLPFAIIHDAFLGQKWRPLLAPAPPKFYPDCASVLISKEARHGEITTDLLVLS